jgi:hypothetical protein
MIIQVELMSENNLYNFNTKGDDYDLDWNLKRWLNQIGSENAKWKKWNKIPETFSQNITIIKVVYEKTLLGVTQISINDDPKSISLLKNYIKNLIIITAARLQVLLKIEFDLPMEIRMAVQAIINKAEYRRKRQPYYVRFTS